MTAQPSEREARGTLSQAYALETGRPIAHHYWFEMPIGHWSQCDRYAIRAMLAFADRERADEREALESIAARLVDQHDEPWPSGTESERLHYWRDKAIRAAAAIRNRKDENDG